MPSTKPPPLEKIPTLDLSSGSGESPVSLHTESAVSLTPTPDKQRNICGLQRGFFKAKSSGRKPATVFLNPDPRQDSTPAIIKEVQQLKSQQTFRPPEDLTRRIVDAAKDPGFENLLELCKTNPSEAQRIIRGSPKLRALFADYATSMANSQPMDVPTTDADDQALKPNDQDPDVKLLLSLIEGGTRIDPRQLVERYPMMKDKIRMLLTAGVLRVETG